MDAVHKNIGLFCKRALSKRLYFAKERYIFKVFVAANLVGAWIQNIRWCLAHRSDVWRYVCIHKYTCTYVQIRMYVVDVYTYIHIYIYMYIHTYICT